MTDFRISYLSDGFRDPAGRDAADLAGRPLLEMYPAAALSGGLFDRAVEVLATGEPQYTSGEIIAAPVAGGLAAPVLEVRIARLYDGVVDRLARRRRGRAPRPPCCSRPSGSAGSAAGRRTC